MTFSIGKLIFSLLLLSGFTVGLWFWNAQAKIEHIDAPLPESFPTRSFSHHTFELLLKRFVDKRGDIDYEGWKKTPNAHYELKQYLAAVAKFSPENAPERFASEQDALAYWIYSYNALVIHSILENWPLRSVTDIKAPLEVIKGLGFFYKQQFIIGGKAYNLYHLEQQKMVHTKADPRLHFVLNCGSASCPPMRPELPVGVDLVPFLQQAAIEFINDPNNVRVNAKRQRLELSKIFSWYIDDFADVSPLTLAARADKKLPTPGKELALISYIQQFAAPHLNKQIERASSQPLEYIEYDWSLNTSQGEDSPHTEREEISR
ncbi:hypothetical protein Ssed_4049 [Shewanella sediminis HAW-EB3]|uniref:DUF547 domain-containing protein n=1 Tax=Shewanella sediminis (strain HAW-EB3) TaxID=425104 RepID=A8G0N0_SHESH|nr:DUF547 domain-containing protein [Shewanella sediminis]ABV38653.1 hypothetical protein Ssed_4049 [Shewanella sediminis HAW-EB3]